MSGSSPDAKAAVQLVRLRTKYYHADVEFHVHRVRANEPENALAHDIGDYEAIICVTDVNRAETFVHVHRFLEQATDSGAFEVCLLVGNKVEHLSTKTSHVEDVEAWCQENAFEFVPVAANCDTTREEPALGETEGIDRVLEALHCNMWRSMTMLPREEPNQSVDKSTTNVVEDSTLLAEGKPSNNQETDSDDKPRDQEALEALLGSMELSDDTHATKKRDGTSNQDEIDEEDLDMAEFSTLINEVRRMREQGQTLSDAQRRQQAEAVAMRLWNYLGCDEESESDSDCTPTASTKMATTEAPKELNLMDLPIEQLNGLKSQLESELKQLTASFGGLREAQSRFIESKEALNNLSDNNKDKEILVPLTSSMFVPGTLTNVQEVLVDVGTGYFVEHNVDNAKAFMDRKIEFLKTNTESLQTVLSSKRNMLEGVITVMQHKLRIADQQAAQ
ncbi:TPA: hypothetical protein N0F65_006015 [Lagenidium giganteum]|uniref:Uncharacterized protein n=1 Tax=Lagenidium giganteum TaxID=4803 RepID=A0AAV2Z5B1_9STRA|nr:TPA: hypothetical protein N0F65_006015 [Lagenidium giganteum]